MALKMQVQSSEVVATVGMRIHIGLNVKLKMVAGTHTFDYRGGGSGGGGSGGFAVGVVEVVTTTRGIGGSGSGDFGESKDGNGGRGGRRRCRWKRR